MLRVALHAPLRMAIQSRPGVIVRRGVACRDDAVRSALRLAGAHHSVRASSSVPHGHPRALGDSPAAVVCVESAWTGPYARTREALDYNWHTVYSPARQALQDAIIAKYLASGKPSRRPWIVYTAGAMGAGKSHTVRCLAAQGAFPLSLFVQVDMDRIRWDLPEMECLVAADPVTAPIITQREAGYLAEIIEREAVRQGK
ncbi:hypothetical protein EON68_03530, partial [archaeon]